jgi:UDP-GlcNAc:undecaprenyl-phosphate GlcNAc-1-phosphate transferase
MSHLTAIPAWLGAVVTIVAMLALRPLARQTGLLDRPSGHKRHRGEIPVVGGVAMLAGLIAAVLATPGGAFDASIFLVAAAILVTVGVLDDAFVLPPRLRLVAHAGAALWMYTVSTSGVHVTTLGDLFGTGRLDFGAFAPVATVVVIVAGINAFNMLDGLDGLAGGVALVALALLLTALPKPLCPAFTQIALALGGGLAGFLLFNAPLGLNRRWRAFMGDAGSTLLGFALATIMIGSSQGVGRLATPITMAWLVLVPATDLVWSVVRRLARGQSPFRPDNAHLHHTLMQAGLSSRATSVALVLVALVGGLAGLALEHIGAPEWLSFVLFVLAGWGLVFGAYALRHVRRRANRLLELAELRID